MSALFFKALETFPVCLAPMEDVTNWAFRQICKKFGADILITEFVSSEGLIRDAWKSKRKMKFDENERPIGIQIFGHDVNSMREAALIAESYKPDFIDINAGCPVKKVVNKGAGAALLKDIDKMVTITDAVVKAVKLPVSVKTRIGWDEKNINISIVAEKLQDVGIACLTVHGRTRSQLYTGTANWQEIAKLKSNQNIRIPIIGNGDIKSISDALLAKNQFGLDGIMIGRAAIGNPWIFEHIKQSLNFSKPERHISIKERVAICKEHLLLLLEEKGNRSGVNEMRQHYASYFKGIEHFKPYKIKLLTIKEPEEIIACLDKIEVLFSQDNEV